MSTTAVDSVLEQIRSGPRGPRIAAFFDFDGTLIDGYSAEALYGHRLRNLEVGPTELFHTVKLMRSEQTLTEEQFGELLERGIAGWAGRPACPDQAPSPARPQSASRATRPWDPSR